MEVFIRYTKGLGNAALGCRLRNNIGQHWNFSTSTWGATESYYTLTEYADSDPYESTYLRTLVLPTIIQAPVSIVEVFVVATGEVIGQENTLDYRSQEASSKLTFDASGNLLVSTGTSNILIPSMSGAMYSPTIKQGAKLSVIRYDTPTFTATLNNDYSNGWVAELVMSMEDPVVKKTTKICTWVDITTGALMVDLTAEDTTEVGVYDCVVKVRQGLTKTLTVLQFTMLVLKDE